MRGCERPEGGRCFVPLRETRVSARKAALHIPRMTRPGAKMVGESADGSNDGRKDRIGGGDVTF